MRNNVGVLKDKNGKYIRYGLGNGSSDLIGWHTIRITPDMVGRKVAIFTALEIKAEDGIATKEQENFIAQVKAAGGYAGIVRTETEALEVFSDL